MPDWSPGSVIAGDFVVERDLGSGGFGHVVLVRNRRSGESYAAKRIAAADPVEQGGLLTEAQRWMSLPAHPHIATCHFVRTIEDATAIFSEYAPGGSLADRIASGALYEGGERAVLTVALQIAWGLDAAHSLGMLHLDTKPANVLFDEAGVAKMTDFGLAARRALSAQTLLQEEALLDYLTDIDIDPDRRERLKDAFRAQLAMPGENESIAAVPGGLTHAYASPEQAEGRTVGRGADTWSWGVTVLEMFAGRRTWPSGTVAGAVLEAALRGDIDLRLPIPPRTAEILRACFALDPAARPRSLHAVAEDLRPDVPGLSPPPRASMPAVTALATRQSGEGTTWEDPRAYLGYAYATSGRDPVEAVERRPDPVGGRMARALEDLRAFDDARRLLESAPPTDESRYGLARVITNQAQIRRTLRDLAGACGDFEAAVRALDGAASAECREFRALVMLPYGIVLRAADRTPEALAASDAAIDGSWDIEDPVSAAQLRGSAQLAKANTLIKIGESAEEASQLLRTAAAALRDSGNLEGAAKAMGTRAALLTRLQRPDEAGALWAELDAMLGDSAEQSSLRAMLSLSRAKLAQAFPDRLTHAAAAVDLYTPLVERDGHYDLAGELGEAYLYLGYAHEHLAHPRESLAAYCNGRILLEQAVLREGRSDLANTLSECAEFESTLTLELEGPEQALDLQRRSIATWRRLTGLDGADAWGSQLARALTGLAGSLREIGDPAALELLDEAARAIEAMREPRPHATRRIMASIHRERGVSHRKAGDLAAAHQECAAAVTLLADSEDPAEISMRVLALETLSAVLAESGHVNDGLAMLEWSVADVEALVAAGLQPQASLPESRQRLAGARFDAGLLDEAWTALSAAYSGFEELVRAGRDDLRTEAARTASLAGEIMLRLGRPEQAVSAFQDARGHWEALAPGDLRVRRMMSSPDTVRRAQERAGAMPGAAAPAGPEAIVEIIGRRIAEIQEMLAVRAGDVPAFLATIRERKTHAGQLTRSGLPRDASRIMEELAGSLLWLSRTHPGEHVSALLGEIGIGLGLTSMHSRRDAAAIRGFTLAVEQYEALVTESGLEAYRDDWFRALYGLAACLAFLGDQAGVARVADELDRLAPHRAAEWRAKIQEMLDALR
ncbi:serine/threonine protein kinase [Streptosporangiaceae bacterium NEAU-GS5]|nr:serine/threonine protein kinase [Streptosporangiaceae bacterium NEAU-GS5]